MSVIFVSMPIFGVVLVMVLDGSRYESRRNPCVWLPGSSLINQYPRNYHTTYTKHRVGLCRKLSVYLQHCCPTICKDPARYVGKSLNTVSFVTYFFQIFPVIIFFSVVIAILYHYGIIQKMISVIASLMEFTMATTPAESFNAAGNIFIGMVSVIWIETLALLSTPCELFTFWSNALSWIWLIAHWIQEECLLLIIVTFKVVIRLFPIVK